MKAINYESFTFSFYKPGVPTNILVSMDTNCRLHRSTIKPEYMGKTHNLVEFLKAYLIGGIVKDIRQVNFNRIIEIKVINNNTTYYLIIRLWGGFPNIIITSEDYTILHLHKKSSKKMELPGSKYQYPEVNKNRKEYELLGHTYQDYNSFIEAEYIERITQQNSDKLLKKTIQFREKRRKEINNSLKKITSRLDNYSKAELYKLQGDLILSNIHLIKRGDTSLNAVDYTSNTTLEIQLDPRIKPDQNSTNYYKKHQKALAGISVTKEQIANLEQELLSLDSLPVEQIDQNKTIKKPSKQTVNRPGLYYRSAIWEIIIGRSAKENETLLRRFVKGNDMWLHVRDYPGGYVFIKNIKGKTIPLDVLLDAGTLALFYSKAKNNGKGDITYTQVKYLRRVKNGKPGQVIPTMNKNLYVTLDKKRLDRIKP